MPMNHPDNKKLSNTFQRALLVIAAIALSGAVYFFMHLSSTRSAQALEQNEAYAELTETPELFGAKESVVLSEIKNAGVTADGENGRYKISISDGGLYAVGEVEFTKRDGYVVGLTLLLRAIEKPESPKSTKDNTIIGEYEIMLEQYKTDLEERQKLLHSVLSALTGLIDKDGELPMPKLYEWEAKVEYLDGSAPLFSDKFERYFFTASISGTGALTVSLVG